MDSSSLTLRRIDSVHTCFKELCQSVVRIPLTERAIRQINRMTALARSATNAISCDQGNRGH